MHYFSRKVLSQSWLSYILVHLQSLIHFQRSYLLMPMRDEKKGAKLNEKSSCIFIIDWSLQQWLLLIIDDVSITSYICVWCKRISDCLSINKQFWVSFTASLNEVFLAITVLIPLHPLCRYSFMILSARKGRKGRLHYHRGENGRAHGGRAKGQREAHKIVSNSRKKGSVASLAFTRTENPFTSPSPVLSY